MLDFTSSLYLGFRHSTQSLRPWSQLTTGAPAVLEEPAATVAIAHRLAQLQGCERAVLARSTLHLFWDLFGMLPSKQVAIYLDAGAYPTIKWGVERAAGRGVPVWTFPHNDEHALAHMLRQNTRIRRPIVVADGVCGCCGCAAPIASYLELVQSTGGMLVVDDTQALGIVGYAPGPEVPYGWGGGGSLRLAGMETADVLVVSSLAKAFGVPMAVLSGKRALVERFEAASEIRVHCSQPSAADLHAAEHALTINAQHGDTLRSRLAERVHFFQRRLREMGIAVSGGLFPIQTVMLAPDLDVRHVYANLWRNGVRTVLRRGQHAGDVHLSFIVTVQHAPDMIARATQVLAATVRPPQFVRGGG